MKITQPSLKYVAGAMVGATLVFLITRSLPLYAGWVAVVLGWFGYHHRADWQIFGWWGGVANVLTALRALLLVGLCLAVPALHSYVTLVLGILVLVLDGLDGHYARKYGTVSAFGDGFDKEVDALFVLTFGIIIVEQQLAGSWILLPGLLRYAYVIGLSLRDRPPSPAGKSFRRQFVGMWLMGTLLAPFALPPIIYIPGLIFATATVTLSFVTDFYSAVKGQSVEVEA